MRRYVTYVRVSTQEQGRSGLGLEAQQRDIAIFLANYSDVPFEVVGEFRDIGSGADNERPELGKAIALAKKHGAELLVAKLDRLSRKVSHLANLMDDKALRIRVASMPNADKFQLHIYAALAEQERDFISVRTKAALQAAKARGVKLGGDRGNIGQMNRAKMAKADVGAGRAMKLIEPLRSQGWSLARIAERLNDYAVGGSNWSPTKVKRALDRGVA